MFNWFTSNENRIHYNVECDYCGELTNCKLIGDLVYSMNMGSYQCKKCELASDIHVDKLIGEYEKNKGKNPTKQQLEHRKWRDKIIIKCGKIKKYNGI